MHWTKLNTTFDAEPNAPEPRVHVYGNIITVRFFLNSFIWKDVEAGEEAVLTFRDVFMYRLGPTNDEGFYKGQCRFSSSGIEWGHFYELEQSDWRNSFPEDRVVVDPTMAEMPGLRHYLYYFRDETFECLAKSYDFGRVDK